MHLDIEAIYINDSADSYTGLLAKSSWEQATVYRLSTGSTYWNTASVISLPKDCAATAPVALLYLLQAEARSLEIFADHLENAFPSTAEFINAVLAERRFSNNIGKEVSIESFWKTFVATMQGMVSQEGFEFTVNAVATPYQELLHKNVILHVICFDESWQEQNYFIETSGHWMLYNWTTGA
ncbi:MAG TPA: hypothetical protein VLR49_13370 [Ferruginibacter sp.]|nr:hypothetical protein [Ferruginibacter sp.]